MATFSTPTLSSVFPLLLGLGTLTGISCTSHHRPAGTAATIPATFATVDRTVYEAHGKRYGIATQGFEATRIAREVLDAGGNLVDAALAVSFAISVERPQSTGLGGGGFFLYREAKTGKIYAVDFRERAPKRATKDMYLDKNGEVVKDLSVHGALAVGIPGLVAGLGEVHARFASKSLAELVEPSAKLAEKGFKVYPHLANAMQSARLQLARYPETRKIFLRPDGEPFAVGETLVQKDLAKTLRAIGKKGRPAVYAGAYAKSLAKEVKRLGGIVDAKDLAGYRVHWREPVEGVYKGFRVVSMPPPSSGGAHVVEILNMLESDDLKTLGFGKAASLHLTAAVMQQAFADRAQHLGDSDFVKVPLKGLVDKKYAALLRARISPVRARKSEEVFAGDPLPFESTDTTHFSMIDSEGNMIASTQTINGYFGSGVVVPGAGVLLNNEMDDFSAKPGVANIFGAVGGSANAVQAGKAPLSSMSPTLVLEGERPRLVLGAPGGTRIITCVAQTILNHLEYGMGLYDSVAAIRLHHQWKPDQLDIDAPGPGAAEVAKLTKMGYKVEVGAVPCRVNAVSFENGEFTAAADPRDIGSAAAQ